MELPEETHRHIEGALRKAYNSSPRDFDFFEYREKNKHEIAIFCLKNPQLYGKKTDEIVIKYICENNCILNDDQLEELFMKYFIRDYKK